MSFFSILGKVDKRRLIEMQACARDCVKSEEYSRAEVTQLYRSQIKVSTERIIFNVYNGSKEIKLMEMELILVKTPQNVFLS